MHITNVRLGKEYAIARQMADALAFNGYTHSDRWDHAAVISEMIAASPLGRIDGIVKEGGNLTFEQAYAGMMFVIGATNTLVSERIFPHVPQGSGELVAKGSSFLQLMAMKEVTVGLSPDEVAGMVAAGMFDVLVYPRANEIVETCGMGGDRGFSGDRTVKTINVSTLSALTLAAMGYPAMKHGSLGNTTTVGSSDVPVRFGAGMLQATQQEIEQVLTTVGFWYSDAHAVKTLHYLSHLLMHETVNHVVGPMTPPVDPSTRLNKVIGVNHHVPPWIIAKAYSVLHSRGIMNVGNVAVVCGLDTTPPKRFSGGEIDAEWVHHHALLDEVSPFATLVSLTSGGDFIGTYVLTDEHFGDEHIEVLSIVVPNNVPDLMRANHRTLAGTDSVMSAYLARNAALGKLMVDGFDVTDPFSLLCVHTQACFNTISSGQVEEKLLQYVAATGGKFQGWL